MSPCKLFYVVLCIAGSVLLHQVSAQELQCTVVLSRRVSCGGGTLEQCGNRGCCYDDSAPSAEIPSCYFPLNEVPRFSEWKSWSSCSRSCGSEGRITRERSCEYPDGRIAPSDLCFGTDFEEQQCNRVACPGVQLATTVSAAVSAQGTSSASPTCEDSLGDSCERFKSLCGGSGSLSNSLQRFCRKTCNLCGDDAGVDAGADAPTKSSSTTASTTTTTLPPTKYPLTVCEDEYDTCNRVKDLCDEPEHSEDLRRYCRRTCNMCLTTTTTTTTTTEKSCVDGNSERCARFSTFCSTPNIQQFCPKTCGTCKEDNDLVTSPQTSVQTTSLVTVILTTPLPTTTTTTRRPVQVPSVNRNPGNNVVNNLVCRDDLDFCTKVDGLCENTIYRSVWQQCRLTCGLCDPNQSADSARATGVCVDELHYCNILQPVCNDLQYEPMTSKCPQTCNRCSSPARRPQQPPSPGFTPIRQPPSTIRQPPSTIRQPPSTIRQPPSTIRQPPTTIRQPPATTLTQIFVTQPTTTTTPPTTTPPTTTTTTTATTPPTTTSLITSTSEPTSTNEPEMPGDNTRWSYYVEVLHY
ncbi:unnamed protein product [Clavelina lepadiformis]|uniref:Uncharacterized protein n=1 Tax=Clavelina lepadiformis TaxID=159417 RepID=A0ABP0G633_CLALP